MSDLNSNSELDQQIILATQAGLPLVKEPYKQLADQLGVDEALVMNRFNAMVESGQIRRIAAVPNHYKLGFTGNGMTVWDLPDEKIKELGTLIGDLDFVSHCYHRPRHQPLWNYNLFAMVHGRSREEVLEKTADIAEMLGEHRRDHQVLFSTRILKKTGLRFKQK